MLIGTVRLSASSVALQAGERRVMEVGTRHFVHCNNFMFVMSVDELISFIMYYLKTMY
jgi:hypothetical protein